MITDDLGNIISSYDPWMEAYMKLKAEVERLGAQNAALRAALEKIVGCIPACNDGELVVRHCDEDGNELGFERVDPLSVIQSIAETARAALDAKDNQ